LLLARWLPLAGVLPLTPLAIVGGWHSSEACQKRRMKHLERKKIEGYYQRVLYYTPETNTTLYVNYTGIKITLN